MSYLENARILKTEMDLREKILTEAEQNGDYTIETRPGDKLGTVIEVHCIGGTTVEVYREIPNYPGTRGNPIPWEPELTLIAGAFYTYEGEMKSWWGVDGICAEWSDEGFLAEQESAP